MLAGEMYLAGDPELVSERERCERLMRAYNADGDEAVLRQLIGAVGKETYIRPPFFCDYGYNITLGDKVFVNFNCVILGADRPGNDGTTAHIGGRAPGHGAVAGLGRG